MLLVQALDRQERQRADATRGVESFDDPRARAIRSSSTGAFDLHACVEALFTLSTPQAAQAAA